MTAEAPNAPRGDEGESTGVLGSWLKSGLAAMAVILALAGGVVALVMTPREEEPQIDVPLIDVFVEAPGLTAEEVERRIVWPMEQTLFATRGVEYVYSSSAADGAIVTARFYVGPEPGRQRGPRPQPSRAEPPPLLAGAGRLSDPSGVRR